MQRFEAEVDGSDGALSSNSLLRPVQVRDMLLEEMRRIGKEHKLAGFKIPKHVVIEVGSAFVNPTIIPTPLPTPHPTQQSDIDSSNQGFRTDNDLVTPTLKLRRGKMKDRYKDQVEAVYRQDSAAGVAAHGSNPADHSMNIFGHKSRHSSEPTYSAQGAASAAGSAAAGGQPTAA